jgi:hypothetical protein
MPSLSRPAHCTCVRPCCTIHFAGKRQMVGSCQSPERAHNFKTDHNTLRYSLVDATFGVRQPKTSCNYILFAIEIHYSEHMKGVHYGTLASALWVCLHQEEESSSLTALLMPPIHISLESRRDKNREYEGNELDCMDRQNTNASKEEKERDLENNADAKPLTRCSWS